MEVIVKYFIERKVLVKVLLASIFLLGLRSLISIPKEGFPSVALNKAVVKATYPGASAKDVEFNLTIPLEEEILEVDGIEEVESVSRDNQTIITVTVDQNEDETYFDQVFMKIKDAVDATQDLPSNLKGKPTVEKLTSFDAPIIEIALSGERKIVRTHGLILKDLLRKIPEVSAVDEVGLEDQEVVITVDPKLAINYGIDLKAIVAVIRNRNVEGTGGTFTINQRDYKVTALNRFQNLQELLDTPLRTNDDGSGIRLKDVAKANYQGEDRKLSIRNNGKEGASLLIKQKRGTDVVKAMNHIETLLKNYQTPDSLSIKLIADQARFTKDRLQMVVSNSLFGVIIVAIILFLILDWRSAFWTAFGIPFSLIATFSLFPLFDITLNAVALGGFIIMIGILVDDAIVVAEQITTFKEMGMPPKQAAIRGVAEVWKPVLAATTTTIVAFTPLLSMSGLPGKFIWVIPLVVTIILSFSLFESYFFLPTHLLYTLKEKKSKAQTSLKKLEHVYKKVLTKLVRHRYLTLCFFLSTLLISIFVMKNLVHKDTFPQKGADTFYIELTFPSGTTKEQAINKIAPLEDLLESLPKTELMGYSVRIGTHSEDQRMYRGAQYNLAKIFVYLTPFSERDRSVQEIMSDLEKRSKSLFEQQDHLSFILKRIGPPIGYDFEIDVVANDDQIRNATVAKISKMITNIKGVEKIENNNLIGNPELNFKINYAQLSSFGLTVQEVVQTLQMTFDGLVITKTATLGGMLDYRIQVQGNAKDQQQYFKNIPIMNQRGQLVDLSKVVTIEEHQGQAEITHFNGRRSTKVFGSVDKFSINPESIMTQVKKQFPDNQNYNLEFGGEAAESAIIFKDVKIAGITALLGIYLILALIFNSFKIPFAVMSIIPFLLVGVAWALFTHGEPMGMFSAMAMVGLMGIVVNDSIVMIDTILKREGDRPLHIDVIIDGATSRLRAILLTTLTTVCGLFPTAYGLGGYDFFISPMCLSMSWGLLFSTLCVLLLLPCFLAIGLDIKSGFKAKKAILAG